MYGGRESAVEIDGGMGAMGLSRIEGGREGMEILCCMTGER